MCDKVIDSALNALPPPLWKNRYQALFPVKANACAQTVTHLLQYGRPFHHGLEAGSKPELLLTMWEAQWGGPQMLEREREKKALLNRWCIGWTCMIHSIRLAFLSGPCCRNTAHRKPCSFAMVTKYAFSPLLALSLFLSFFLSLSLSLSFSLHLPSLYLHLFLVLPNIPRRFPMFFDLYLYLLFLPPSAFCAI